MPLVFATFQTSEKRLIIQSINIVMNNKSPRNTREYVALSWNFQAILQQQFSIKSVCLHGMKGTLFWTEPIFEHCSFNLVLELGCSY